MKATIVLALALITAVAYSEQQWTPILEGNNQELEDDVADTGNPATKVATRRILYKDLGGGENHSDGGTFGERSGYWGSGLTNQEPEEENNDDGDGKDPMLSNKFEQEHQQPKLQDNDDPMPGSPADEASEPGYRMLPVFPGYAGGGYPVDKPMIPVAPAVPAMPVASTRTVKAVLPVPVAPTFPAITGGMGMGPGTNAEGYDFPQTVDSDNLTLYYNDLAGQQKDLKAKVADWQSKLDAKKKEIAAKMKEYQRELAAKVKEQKGALEAQRKKLDDEEEKDEAKQAKNFEEQREKAGDLLERTREMQAETAMGMKILKPHIPVLTGQAVVPGPVVPGAPLPGAPFQGAVLPAAGFPATMPFQGGPVNGYPMPGSLGGPPMLGLEMAARYPYRRRHSVPLDRGGFSSMYGYEEPPDLQQMRMMRRVQRLRAQRRGFPKRNRMYGRRQWGNEMYDDY